MDHQLISTDNNSTPPIYHKKKINIRNTSQKSSLLMINSNQPIKEVNELISIEEKIDPKSEKDSEKVSGDNENCNHNLKLSKVNINSIGIISDSKSILLEKVKKKMQERKDILNNSFKSNNNSRNSSYLSNQTLKTIAENKDESHNNYSNIIKQKLHLKTPNSCKIESKPINIKIINSSLIETTIEYKRLLNIRADEMKIQSIDEINFRNFNGFSPTLLTKHYNQKKLFNEFYNSKKIKPFVLKSSKKSSAADSPRNSQIKSFRSQKNSLENNYNSELLSDKINNLTKSDLFKKLSKDDMIKSVAKLVKIEKNKLILPKGNQTINKKTTMLDRRKNYSKNIQSWEKDRNKTIENYCFQILFDKKIILIQQVVRKFLKKKILTSANCLNIQRHFRGFLFRRKNRIFYKEFFFKLIYTLDRLLKFTPFRQLFLFYQKKSFFSKIIRNLCKIQSRLRKFFLRLNEKNFKLRHIIFKLIKSRAKLFISSLNKNARILKFLIKIQSRARGYIIRRRASYMQYYRFKFNPLLFVLQQKRMNSAYIRIKTLIYKSVKTLKKLSNIIKIINKLKQIYFKKNLRFFEIGVNLLKDKKKKIKIVVQLLRSHFPKCDRKVKRKFYQIWKEKYKISHIKCILIKHCFRRIISKLFFHKFIESFSQINNKINILAKKFFIIQKNYEKLQKKGIFSHLKRLFKNRIFLKIHLTHLTKKYANTNLNDFFKRFKKSIYNFHKNSIMMKYDRSFEMLKFLIINYYSVLVKSKLFIKNHIQKRLRKLINNRKKYHINIKKSFFHRLNNNGKLFALQKDLFHIKYNNTDTELMIIKSLFSHLITKLNINKKTFFLYFKNKILDKSKKQFNVLIKKNQIVLIKIGFSIFKKILHQHKKEALFKILRNSKLNPFTYQQIKQFSHFINKLTYNAQFKALLLIKRKVKTIIISKNKNKMLILLIDRKVEINLALIKKGLNIWRNNLIKIEELYNKLFKLRSRLLINQLLLKTHLSSRVSEIIVKINYRKKYLWLKSEQYLIYWKRVTFGIFKGKRKFKNTLSLKENSFFIELFLNYSVIQKIRIINEVKAIFYCISIIIPINKLSHLLDDYYVKLFINKLIKKKLICCNFKSVLKRKFTKNDQLIKCFLNKWRYFSQNLKVSNALSTIENFIIINRKKTKLKEKISVIIKNKENEDSSRLKYYFYFLKKRISKLIIIKSLLVLQSVLKKYLHKLRTRIRLATLSRKLFIYILTSSLKAKKY